MEHYEERSQPSNAFVLTANGVVHKISLERDGAGKNKSTSLQSFELIWESNRSLGKVSKDQKTVLSPLSKKLEDREASSEIEVDSSPRRLCASKDGKLICVFGKKFWGIFMVSWLSENGNKGVPVVLVAIRSQRAEMSKINLICHAGNRDHSARVVRGLLLEE